MDKKKIIIIVSSIVCFVLLLFIIVKVVNNSGQNSVNDKKCTAEFTRGESNYLITYDVNTNSNNEIESINYELKVNNNKINIKDNTIKFGEITKYEGCATLHIFSEDEDVSSVKGLDGNEYYLVSFNEINDMPTYRYVHIFNSSGKLLASIKNNGTASFENIEGYREIDDDEYDGQYFEIYDAKIDYISLVDPFDPNAEGELVDEFNLKEYRLTIGNDIVNITELGSLKASGLSGAYDANAASVEVY